MWNSKVKKSKLNTSIPCDWKEVGQFLPVEVDAEPDRPTAVATSPMWRDSASLMFQRTVSVLCSGVTQARLAVLQGSRLENPAGIRVIESNYTSTSPSLTSWPNQSIVGTCLFICKKEEWYHRLASKSPRDEIMKSKNGIVIEFEL